MLKLILYLEHISAQTIQHHRSTASLVMKWIPGFILVNLMNYSESCSHSLKINFYRYYASMYGCTDIVIGVPVSDLEF